MRFPSRGSAFTDAENQLLAEHPPLTGADYAHGERPSHTGTCIVTETVDAPPQAGGTPSRPGGTPRG